MEFKTEETGDVTLLTLPGEVLDAGNCEEFKKDVEPFIRANKKMVFDLSEMRFVDSSGCGALLSCLRKARDRDGELKMCHVQKPVKELFKLIRMDRVFDFYDSREEAVKALQ